ncbi:hypothetical protein EDD18DRAFT_37784 [Armillaria luteobubalina]|uniref:Uncharacterized protein n=1 Tax=Armillaria luteobubalina TaxID=153913 RepID=A0AA39QP83_9AGAR|nr:hypothetical protein EDD18DRAFT_37784 [Armillaria luteobubalina]
MQYSNSRAGRALRIILVLIFLSERSDAVQWESPAAGDRFGPGDVLVGKWRADSPVDAPSFKVCGNSSSSSLSPPPQVSSRDSDDQTSGDSDTGNCGETVWPTVQHGNGSDSVSLAVPNVTSDESFYLLMIDNFGTKYRSPPFLLSSTSSATVQDAAPAPLSNSNNAQSPFDASLPSVPYPAASPVGGVPVTPPTVSPASLPVSPTNILATRSPPPVAAFAVPLCCVGAILLVAAGLCVRHNRQLDRERARDTEKLAISRNSSFGSLKSYQNDMLSKSQGDMYHYGSAMPVPLFMPVEMPRERTRQRTRQMPYFVPPLYYHESRRKRHYSHSTSSRSSTRSDSSHSSHSRSSITPPSPKNSDRVFLPSISASPLVVDLEERDGHHSASVTDDVLSEYMQPSPLLPDCLLPAPQKLHIRKEATDLSEGRKSYTRMDSIDLFDAVQNTLRRSHNT